MTCNLLIGIGHSLQLASLEGFKDFPFFCIKFIHD